MKLKIHVFTMAISLVFAAAASAQQTFEIDASHASIGFAIDHLVISKVRGDFREFTGTVTLDDTGAVQKVSAAIDVNSIDTGVENRDNHLKSPDFFDVANFPQIKFESISVRRDEGQSVLIGDLTIHGVAREVELPFTVKGPVTDPYGKTRIGLTAETVLNRKDFGLTWNNTLETGGLVVGEVVEVQISFEAIKQ